MFVKSNAKRLITINDSDKSYQVKPGQVDPTEVPDTCKKLKFVKALLTTGDLVEVAAPSQVVQAESEYDDMTKAELIELAETMGVDVVARDSKADIIAKIEAE